MPKAKVHYKKGILITSSLDGAVHSTNILQIRITLTDTGTAAQCVYILPQSVQPGRIDVD